MTGRQFYGWLDFEQSRSRLSNLVHSVLFLKCAVRKGESHFARIIVVGMCCSCPMLPPFILPHQVCAALHNNEKTCFPGKTEISMRAYSFFSFLDIDKLLWMSERD